MTIYELYGRVVEEREREMEAHLQTIAMLRQIVTGEVPRERVTVTETGWTLVPVAPAKVLPMPAAESA
jgi:hypothetical protein